MSSRLFQTIREERGMAYSIYSDLSPYRDTGTLCVYAGTSAARLSKSSTSSSASSPGSSRRRSARRS